MYTSNNFLIINELLYNDAFYYSVCGNKTSRDKYQLENSNFQNS